MMDWGEERTHQIHIFSKHNIVDIDGYCDGKDGFVQQNDFISILNRSYEVENELGGRLFEGAHKGDYV